MRVELSLVFRIARGNHPWRFELQSNSEVHVFPSAKKWALRIGCGPAGGLVTGGEGWGGKKPGCQVWCMFLFCCFCFLFWPRWRGRWDLSSLTRERARTRAPCSRSTDPTEPLDCLGSPLEYPSYVWGLCPLFFLPVSLRYNWHTVLCKFKVYSIMIWLPYIMKC